MVGRGGGLWWWVVGCGGWWCVLCLECVHRQTTFFVHNISSLALKTNEPKSVLSNSAQSLEICVRFRCKITAIAQKA